MQTISVYFSSSNRELTIAQIRSSIDDLIKEERKEQESSVTNAFGKKKLARLQAAKSTLDNCKNEFFRLGPKVETIAKSTVKTTHLTEEVQITLSRIRVTEVS